MKKVRIGLLLAALMTALLALPSASSAGQNCSGRVHPVETGEEGEPPLAGYAFRCEEAFSTFALVTSEETYGFSTEPEINDAAGNAAPGNTVSNCEGLLPGRGFSCLANYLAGDAIVGGTFATLDGACARNAQGRISLTTWLVVDSPRRRLTTWRLGKTHRCPRPAPAPAAGQPAPAPAAPTRRR